ncbi:hypothetical protein GIY62_07775 [Burkholderia plantarii]|uniref:hypothetical protein n=1 Tax=Burkholderia plantarii TaxID=41899 RepID=UPI00272A50C1|nr:hypothetical protein [Burkholderia plantarii]WLE60538.1 hypothetical protein GIY62_07775 [Burkholderia plantarii]
MRRRLRFAILALLVASCAGGYGWHMTAPSMARNGTTTMQPDLSFGIGDNGDEVVRTARVPVKRSQLSTALMYDASRIATGVEPVFEFRDARHGMLLPQASDVEFMSDTEEGGKVRTIHVVFKVPVSPTDVHDTAAFDAYDQAMYRYVAGVLQVIRQAGWKRYIPLSSPRLEGKRTYSFTPASYAGPTYAASPSLVEADPGYALTLDDWRHLSPGGTTLWQWYADGKFVELKYERDERSADLPITLGDRLDLRIQSETAWLDTFGPIYETARAKYASEIPAFLQQRHAAEAKARAAGARILTDWTDPAIAGVAVPKP